MFVESTLTRFLQKIVKVNAFVLPLCALHDSCVKVESNPCSQEPGMLEIRNLSLGSQCVPWVPFELFCYRFKIKKKK